MFLASRPSVEVSLDRDTDAVTYRIRAISWRRAALATWTAKTFSAGPPRL